MTRRGMGTGKTLRVRLTSAQQAALAEVSTTTERTESEIVRSALEMVAEYRAAYARARRAGRVATAERPREAAERDADEALPRGGS
jgi:predicted DNA-binding protein